MKGAQTNLGAFFNLETMEDKAFQIANSAAMLGWLIMILLGPSQRTPKVILGILVSLLSIAYVFLIATGLGGFNFNDFSSLAGVMELFTQPRAVLAGWIHYLAFDMLTGLFITMNGAQQGLNRWLLIPCLLLTFMFGPAGWLLYYLMLCIKQRSLVVYQITTV